MATGVRQDEAPGRSNSAGTLKVLPSPVLRSWTSPAPRSTSPTHNSRCCSDLRSPCWTNAASSRSASKYIRWRSRSGPAGISSIASSNSPNFQP